MVGNLTPIAGKTLVLVDASSAMNELFDHKKSPLKTLFDLSAFLSVMISNSASECEVNLFSGSGNITQLEIEMPNTYNA